MCIRDRAGAAGALAGDPLPADLTLSAGLGPATVSRSRRATGASTVEDADFTNSPCSLSFASSSLLVTPSSFANSCTRALPATTSPSLEAMAVVGAAPRFSYDAWSSELHGVLMFFATCSVAGRPSTSASSALKCATTAEVSGEPVIRNARANARRRIAVCKHCWPGCNHAPRPGNVPAASTVTAYSPFPSVTATTRSNSTASSRFRQPTHVRTGPTSSSGRRPRVDTEVSRWVTAESTVTSPANRNRSVGATGPPRCRGRDPCRVRALRRCECRSANPSAAPRAGRSGPPCRSPAKAGSRARPPGRPGRPRR